MAVIVQEFDRPIRELKTLLESGGVVGLATDTTYALVTDIGSRKGVNRLRELRNLPPSKPLSLLLKNLEPISRFAHLSRPDYRIIKSLTPGPFTFVLRATKELPKLMLTRQHTVGIRICGSPIVDALCDALGEPLVSASAATGEETYAETAEETAKAYPSVEIVLDGGHVPSQVSTVVDLTGANPVIIRQGAGVFE